MMLYFRLTNNLHNKTLAYCIVRLKLFRMKFLMPDSCLTLHVWGKFQIQKVQSFPRKRLRKKSSVLHTKNIHWTRCPVITSEYSNRKSGISTDCTWSTAILGNIDTFGDAPTCPLQIRSFSCPPMRSLWSEMCLLFGSHIWLAFQWEQEAWDQSVRHAHWGGGRGGCSMRGVRLGATGDSQAGKSVLHQWSAIPVCPTRRAGQGLVMGTAVSLRPGITTTTPSDGPGPGSSQKASSWGQDREVRGWVQAWLWKGSGKDPGRGPQAEQGSSGKAPTAFPHPNFDPGMGANPAHRQPKHSEGERGHKSSRYALDLASALPNLRVEVNMTTSLPATPGSLDTFQLHPQGSRWTAMLQ